MKKGDAGTKAGMTKQAKPVTPDSFRGQFPQYYFTVIWNFLSPALTW